MRPAPTPTLFPPSTLFRSLRAPVVVPDTTRLPPARITLEPPSVSATVKALTSVRLMLVPVAVTAPTKLERESVELGAGADVGRRRVLVNDRPPDSVIAKPP